MSEIDVSKCEFCYTVSGQPLCMIGANDTRYDDECMKNPNCYYKQLQQAKQYNYDAGQQLIRMSQELQQLKAENEESKEKYAKLQYSYYEATQPNDYATRKSKRADRILNCLDDIEEIIKELTNCGYLDLSDCIDELNEILQLIKQAKEGGE